MRKAPSYVAYFDASGHPHDPKHTALLVAGFVSTANKWQRFDSEWGEILNDQRIKCFHMTDFASSGGEFSDWRNQTDRRRIFIQSLLACTKKNVNKSFRATIELPAFEEANKSFMLSECIGQPFAICALQCWDSVKKWAKRKGVAGRTTCYFEEGDYDKGNFQRRSRDVYDDEPKFLPKCKATAFQAADLFAWKFRTSLQGLLKGTQTRDQEISHLLSIATLRGVPSDAVVFTRESMMDYCKREGIPPRV